MLVTHPHQGGGVLQQSFHGLENFISQEKMIKNVLQEERGNAVKNQKWDETKKSKTIRLW
jgi:hypothetical protein